MDYICCNSTYAVDGDKTSLFPRYPSGDFFCTHSDSLAYQQSWWAVDLQEVYVIIGVDIFGRTDCCSKFFFSCLLNYTNEACYINITSSRLYLHGVKNYMKTISKWRQQKYTAVRKASIDWEKTNPGYKPKLRETHQIKRKITKQQKY